MMPERWSDGLWPATLVTHSAVFLLALMPFFIKMGGCRTYLPPIQELSLRISTSPAAPWWGDSTTMVGSDRLSGPLIQRFVTCINLDAAFALTSRGPDGPTV